MKSEIDERSGCREAAKTPPQCLHLADPDQFAVLGIKIIAHATSEQLQSSTNDNNMGTRSSSTGNFLPSSPSFPPINTSKPLSPSFPPTSFKNPIKASIQHRSRPPSLEPGQRAKEAFSGLGSNLRNLSKSDLSSDVDDHLASSSLAIAEYGLSRSVSQSSASTRSIMTPSNSDIGVHQDRICIRHARQVYSIRPDSPTFAAGPLTPSSSRSVAVRIGSRMEISPTSSSEDHSEIHWEILKDTPIEFVSDVGQAGDGRAGVFSEILRGEQDSPVSEDGSDEEESPTFKEESVDHHSSLDARQLFLKVSPPLQYLRQGSASSFHRENADIVIKARLRLGKFQAKARKSPSGPRTLTWANDHTTTNTIFVSTHSKEKLLDAVNSTCLLHNGRNFCGPLSSPESARLEGISWVKVDEGKASDNLINFEWKWKDLERKTTYRNEVSNERIVQCASAFIELNVELKTARILAAYSFIIAFPPAGSLSTDPVFEEIDGLTDKVSANVNRGIGLGVNDVDLLPASKVWIDNRATSPVTNRSSSKPYLQLRRPVSTGSTGPYNSFSKHRQLIEGAQHPEKPLFIQIKSSIEVDSTPLLQVNHVEIQLDDIEEDGPILRAALQNLERRTINLKKAAKATLKAACDVRISLSQLQASEASLDQSLEACAMLAPSTMGFLNSELLSTKRREIEASREEEREMLQRHVEAPLLALVDMCKTIQEQNKMFESESKNYYTATQRWLSSRSFPQTNSKTSKGSMGMYSPTAVGFDLSSLKQEKVDDRQRLRQARFYLARLDVFRAMNSVHGGEAELQLASHVLAFCRWQCLDKQAKESIHRLEKALQGEMMIVRERGEDIRARYQEVEEQSRELQAVLGMGNVDNDGEVVVLPSSDLRQVGQKIRSILSLLGSNKQPLATSLPPVPDDWNRHKEERQSSSLPLRNSSSPITIASSTGGETSSFTRLHQRLKPASLIESQRQSNEKVMRQIERSSSGSFQVASLPPNSPMRKHFPGSPGIRRSMSHSAAASPKCRESVGDFTLENSPSPTVLRRGNGMSRTSSDLSGTTSGVEDEEDTVLPIARMSLLQPRRAAQQSRKKEGILWAMSKPIGSAVGVDAPRAVSRSQNWKECWVVLSGSGHVGQYAEWKDVKVMQPSQPLIDLRFATVRESRGVERRFTFEIVTRDSRHFFQASTEEEIKEWTSAIAFAIESLLNGTSSIRQIEKVARVAGGFSSFLETGDEFGSQMGAGIVDVSVLGQHKAFSQSLTDLSSGGRLFHRAGGKEEASRKRDSKGSAISSAHLMALSEGYGTALTESDLPRTKAWSRHERGISNKTPVSGYVQQQDRERSIASSSSSWTVEPDYDRKIEEVVQSTFGSSMDDHRRMLSTAPQSRQASQASQEISAAPSSKLSRSKEILGIAAMIENNHCADCRVANPKWASWSLNGEPRCIFICIACSGHHRGMGVSVSRVKSVELDDWTEEQLESARGWGNDRVNSLYEARKEKHITTANTKQYWKAKYVERAWYDESTPIDTLSAQDPFSQSREKSNLMDTRWKASNPNSTRWPSSPPTVFVSSLDDDEMECNERSGHQSPPTTSVDNLRNNNHELFRSSSPSLLPGLPYLDSSLEGMQKAQSTQFTIVEA